jgi:hypothetical protein
MRICVLALFTTLLCAAATLAQPPDTMWTRAYGGTGPDEAFGVCAVSDGGFVAVGRSRSFSSEYNVFAVRVDAMGDTLWMRSYGGAGLDHAAGVCEVAGDGFLIAGYTTSFGAGFYDAYVIRLSNTGDTLWTRTYGTSGADFGYAIVPTADGGFAVAGSSAMSGPSLDAWLLKADANGNVIWQHTYGSTSTDEAFSLQRTSDDGYLLAGRSVPPNGMGTDMYAVRTNSAGDSLWTRRYGNDDWEEGAGAVETMDGGVFIAGWKRSSSNYDYNCFVVQADVNGNQMWSATYGGALMDRATALRQSSDGGAILAGYTASSGAGASDYYFLKFDTNGDTIWSRTCGGSGDDLLHALDVTSDGGYIAAGISNSYGHGSGDFWLVRLPGSAGVAGFVRDSVTNDPLPNVWVSAIGQMNRTRSDALGYFVLALPPGSTYDIITYGQCVARDTAFGVPVFIDSLTMRDLVLGIPEGVVSQTSVNIVAHNHITATETLMVYNTGLGVLDYSVTVNTVPPSGGWLSVVPASGFALPGDSAQLAVQVTADTTDDGVYDLFGWLIVHMNSCPDSVPRVDVIATILDADDPAALPPSTFSLSAYPNPFNPTTTLSFALPHEDRVELVIFDLLGREVRHLLDTRFAAGVHRVTFDAADLPSGLYIARLHTSTATLLQKLMMLK